jgi:hypothetical protein
VVNIVAIDSAGSKFSRGSAAILSSAIAGIKTACGGGLCSQSRPSAGKARGYFGRFGAKKKQKEGSCPNDGAVNPKSKSSRFAFMLPDLTFAVGEILGAALG